MKCYCRLQLIQSYDQNELDIPLFFNSVFDFCFKMKNLVFASFKFYSVTLTPFLETIKTVLNFFCILGYKPLKDVSSTDFICFPSINK